MQSSAKGLILHQNNEPKLYQNPLIWWQYREANSLLTEAHSTVCWEEWTLKSSAHPWELLKNFLILLYNKYYWYLINISSVFVSCSRPFTEYVSIKTWSVPKLVPLTTEQKKWTTKGQRQTEGEQSRVIDIVLNTQKQAGKGGWYADKKQPEVKQAWS